MGTMSDIFQLRQAFIAGATWQNVFCAKPEQFAAGAAAAYPEFDEMQIRLALDFLLSADGNMPVGELRRRFVERFGEELDAEIQRRFASPK